ncbi:hypothetical protein AB0I60_19565 [Actinosynnema sp. NPDC050436]|uniref:hypothetical protein n=1 Tax=Actinosynnema sp. NPDC050436 TaxID=3155659 RepID=UPI0033E8846C
MPTALNRRSLSSLAVTAAAAALLAGGATAANAVPAAGGATAQHRACHVHALSDGRGAEVCRTWTPHGDGTYYGTWQVDRADANVIAQGRFDGKVRNLGVQGSYSRVKDFVTRACDSSGKRCSSWA